jgi:hypothetical protein
VEQEALRLSSAHGARDRLEREGLILRQLDAQILAGLGAEDVAGRRALALDREAASTSPRTRRASKSGARAATGCSPSVASRRSSAA